MLSRLQKKKKLYNIFNIESLKKNRDKRISITIKRKEEKKINLDVLIMHYYNSCIFLLHYIFSQQFTIPQSKKKIYIIYINLIIHLHFLLIKL